MSDFQGWISLNRSISSHWIWNSEPYSKGQAWIDLLIYANHTDTKINIKGTILSIKRGQQARSMVTLAAQWKWSRDKVKRFLDLLESDGMIIQQTSQLTSIITICNYSSFQDGKAADKAADKASLGQQTGSTQGTVNNDNNDNNDNNITTAPAKAVAAAKPKTEYNSQDLISVGVEESVARDFLINRKKQKAPLTETALRGIVREAEKAGLTLAQAIQITTERGWRSFKAEYVMNKQSGQYITFYELATGRKPEF